MTQSILFRDPEQSEADVSPSRPVVILLGSNDPDLPVGPPDVYVQGVKVIDAGVAVHPGATIASNGSLGFDIRYDHPNWVPGYPITVRVVADDTVAVLDESWTFTVVDNQGPILAENTSPAPGEVLASSPGTIDIRLVDPRGLNPPPTDIVDFSVADANAEYASTGEVVEQPVDVLLPPAQQLYSATANFLGREGRDIEIDGARRVIDTVHGPNLITYSGAQIFGDPVVATVYQARGLDVWIDGLQIIASGVTTPAATGAGWVVSITTPANDILVSLTPPAPYPDATRVSVGVRVGDGDATRRNTSIINYSFLVGNDEGPIVTNHVPAPSSRELTLSSPGSDLVFDITDPDGVDSATLNVLVNGVAAITAGAAAGAPYAGSSVGAITDGFQVTLVRSTDYTDGEIAVIDIEADDNDGTPVRTRTTYIVQYGDGSKNIPLTLGSGHLPDDDVRRVVAFDLTRSSFGDPRKYRHNGYGWDGRSYTEGEPDGAADAAWHGVLGDFPMSGWLVVTQTGWTIIDSSPPTPSVYAQANQVADPGWGAAGNNANELNDGDVASGDAVVAVAGDDAVYVTDFSKDRSYRYDNVRLEESLNPLSDLSADQSNGNVSPDVFLGDGPYSRVGLRAFQEGDGPNRIIAVGGTNLNTIFDLAPTKQAELAPETPVIEKIFSLTWKRIRVVNGYILAAGDISGPQATALVLSETQAASNAGQTLLLDDMSTPALPPGEMKDADINSVQTLALAIEAIPDIVYLINALDTSEQATRNVTDLGLVVGTTRISAVALERDCVVGEGYLYAAVSEESTPDSRAVRWREHSAAEPNRSVVLIADGASRSTRFLSALGETEFARTSYVCGFMELV